MEWLALQQLWQQGGARLPHAAAMHWLGRAWEGSPAPPFFAQAFAALAAMQVNATFVTNCTFKSKRHKVHYMSGISFLQHLFLHIGFGDISTHFCGYQPCSELQPWQGLR